MSAENASSSASTSTSLFRMGPWRTTPAFELRSRPYACFSIGGRQTSPCARISVGRRAWIPRSRWLQSSRGSGACSRIPACTCSRTPASARERLRTTPSSRASWQQAGTSTSMMLSARPTGRTRRRRASLICCPAYAGLLLERELQELSRLLDDPARPFVSIVGGAKVDDKIGVLHRLAELADTLLIGGKMAEELRGRNDLDGVPARVELPGDVVAAAAFDSEAESTVVPPTGMPDGWLGLDIGPETRARYAACVAGAGTVFWNGPMGVFEWPRFAEGTRAVAQAVASCSRVHGRRRWRLRPSRGGARPGRQDHLDLDGWGSLARVPRRPYASRRRRDP